MKKFLTTLAALTVIATPAFAQSFDPDNGTGNVLPFSNAPTAPHNNKIVVRRSGLNAFGMVPRTPRFPTRTIRHSWAVAVSAIMKCSVIAMTTEGT